jgi:hypothetical protein
LKKSGIPLKGFKIANGKLEAVQSYRLSVSAKIAQQKSKRVRVSRKAPG